MSQEISVRNNKKINTMADNIRYTGKQISHNGTLYNLVELGCYCNSGGCHARPSSASDCIGLLPGDEDISNWTWDGCSKSEGDVYDGWHIYNTDILVCDCCFEEWDSGYISFYTPYTAWGAPKLEDFEDDEEGDEDDENYMSAEEKYEEALDKWWADGCPGQPKTLDELLGADDLWCDVSLNG